MRKEYFVCDLCDRTADEETAVLGIRISHFDGSVVDLQTNPRQSTKHICEDCLKALEEHFSPKGEDTGL